MIYTDTINEILIAAVHRHGHPHTWHRDDLFGVLREGLEKVFDQTPILDILAFLDTVVRTFPDAERSMGVNVFEDGEFPTMMLRDNECSMREMLIGMIVALLCENISLSNVPDDPKLPACPFCKARNLSVRRLADMGVPKERPGCTFFLECETCGARGPAAGSAERAWELIADVCDCRPSPVA